VQIRLTRYQIPSRPNTALARSIRQPNCVSMMPREYMNSCRKSLRRDNVFERRQPTQGTDTPILRTMKPEDEILDLSPHEKRANGISDWREENNREWFEEQKHLTSSEERGSESIGSMAI
jgi:hypothetical protein